MNEIQRPENRGKLSPFLVTKRKTIEVEFSLFYCEKRKELKKVQGRQIRS